MQVFVCNICNIFKYTYFVEHLWTVVSDNLLLETKNLDQDATEMFISELENEKSLWKMFRVYKNRIAKNQGRN